MSETLTDFPEIGTEDIPDEFGGERDVAPDGLEPEVGAVATDTGLDDPAAPPAAPGQDRELPAYRREQIEQRDRNQAALQERLDRIEAALSRTTPAASPAAPPAASPAAPASDLTPEQQMVRDKFFALFPQAKELFEVAPALLQAAKTMPSIAAEREAHDNMRANTAIATVIDGVAARILGAGKSGQQLRPQARERIVKAFVAYAGGEYADRPTQMPPDVAQRAIRYQSGDPKLFDEFVADYLADFAAPTTRPARVQQAERARVASPRGGHSSAPPPTGPRQPAPDDEDALHGAAWRTHQGNLAAQG